jgi:hypothetical protein
MEGCRIKAAGERGFGFVRQPRVNAAAESLGDVAVR